MIITSVAVSVYALLTKVFPGSLNPDETYARLRDPFGYWNAVGILAALGVPSFACTPDLFPALMAAAIRKEDVGRWASGVGLARTT